MVSISGATGALASALLAVTCTWHFFKKSVRVSMLQIVGLMSSTLPAPHVTFPFPFNPKPQATAVSERENWLRFSCRWKCKPSDSMSGGFSACFYQLTTHPSGSDQTRCASEKSPVCGFLMASECDCQSGLFRFPACLGKTPCSRLLPCDLDDAKRP